MKTSLLLLPVIFLIITSCNGAPPESTSKRDIPKALEDKNSSYEITSKRGYDDLVESLYKELIEKKPAFKELENTIDKLPESEADSTELFEKYGAKNEAFYSSARQHVEQIKDSLLREKMRNLVANSLAIYNSSISQHKEILKAIETKKLVLGDLHAILKITNTLPVITKYQQDNLPTTKPLKGYYKQLGETTKRADALIKK